MLLQSLKAFLSTLLVFAFYNAEYTDLNVLLFGMLMCYILIATIKLFILINKEMYE